ncbi:MAG: GNAT family N-acetyltransferase [Sphingomonadaceae bacterium]|nr:GNAT family N-acetyltransferase [Sphingomonadaceae bacterium]
MQSVSPHPEPGQAPLTLVDFSDDLAPVFRDINAEWIEAMFTLEANDRAILDHPRDSIIDRGGIIRFVAAEGLGVVGTCALIKTGEGVFELTKMGVRAAARGRKAGEFLLAHVVAEARGMAAAGTLTRLYLLTNHRCAAAIHLYEKAGFVHDARVMADFGARYRRADVAMSLPL